MNSASKVVKVVSLKRFMPELALETVPKLKRPRILNPEPVQNIIDDKKSTENSITEEKPVVNNIEDAKFCADNQVLVNRSKIKFRYCSHSPEELVTLREHVDETLVKLGDTFDSRESLRQHLNDNARKWHYYYVCRSSKSKVLEYNCICMAYNIKKRDVVIRKQKKRTTACPCKLRLTIDEVTNKIVVYYVCNHHDHPTTAGAFSQYPHAKYLPQYVKDEFLDLTFVGLDVTLIQKYILSVIGLKIKKKDIWAYAYRFRKKIYKRTFSEKRLMFIQELIKRIRETFGEPADSDLTESIEKPSSNTVISSPNNELNAHPNEDRSYKDLGDHSLGIDTEVIVQYVNEDGQLCDQRGLVINSTDIIHVMNNMYVVHENAKETVDDVFSESLENRRDNIDVLDWKPNKPYNNNSREDINEDFSRMERPANNIAILSDTVYKNRLSPTPETRGVYAEINNFNKYYYEDHRYITYDDRKMEKWDAIRHDEAVRLSASNLTSDVFSEEYIKAPNFSASSPLSVRHCTGHEHLDLLDDPDAILAGGAFLTHDAFLSYVNKRANRWFFYYSLAESGKWPENYVYRCVYGRHRVSKNAYRAKGLRKRNNLKTDCPCLIRLRRLECAPQYLTVLYSCNHHDHQRDERQFNAQAHSRRLPPHMKEEIKDLVMLRVSSDVLRSYVYDETGLVIGGKYFYNLWAGMRRRNEERPFTQERIAFLNEKVKELDFKYGDLKSKNRKIPPQDEKEDCFTPVDMDETARQIKEYSELTDFAEEVCIVQSDALPADNAAKQSRLETRLQNLSHNEILMKVKKLQDSVRCDLRE